VPAPPLALTDVDGRPVSLSEYRGRALLLAFLYSGCRACTLIAQQVRGAIDRLPGPVPVVFVSVDPARDSPARVRSFLEQVSLSRRARYLVGPAAALPGVWRAYHVTTPAAGRQQFETAAPVILIDPSGRERVLYQQEQLTPEALAHDIGKLEGG
jgi:protein SCO1/2